jgi:hypothetical protein
VQFFQGGCVSFYIKSNLKQKIQFNQIFQVVCVLIYFKSDLVSHNFIFISRQSDAHFILGLCYRVFTGLYKTLIIVFFYLNCTRGTGLHDAD